MRKTISALLFTGLLHTSAMGDVNDSFSNELDRHLQACLASTSYHFCNVNITDGILSEAIAQSDDATWETVRYTNTPSISGATVYKSDPAGTYSIYVYEFPSTQIFAGILPMGVEP